MPRPVHPTIRKPLEHSLLEKIVILFSRALTLRCPACASGSLFKNWFTLQKTCPGCALPLEREGDGYFVGAQFLNLVVAEGVWAISFILVMVATWPNPPWDLLQWGSVVLMVTLPIVFFPFSRLTWIALDVLIRPIQRTELGRWPGRGPDG